MLDTDTFVAVGDHDIVHPVVYAGNIDAVGSAEVCAADGEVVEFAVGTFLDNDVEFGSCGG